MKAILMIDMPTRCDNCYLVEEWYNEYDEKVYYCPLHKMNVPKNGDVCEKLKPLPQKNGNKWYRGNERDFQDGYNACIDEMIGEEE